MERKTEIVIGSGWDENMAKDSADDQADYIITKNEGREVSRNVLGYPRGIRFVYCKMEVVYDER